MWRPLPRLARPKGEDGALVSESLVPSDSSHDETRATAPGDEGVERLADIGAMGEQRKLPALWAETIGEEEDGAARHDDEAEAAALDDAVGGAPTGTARGANIVEPLDGSDKVKLNIPDAWALA